MDHPRKQDLSIKNELVLLIITIITITILNITSRNALPGIISSLIIIFVSGYGITLLIFSHKGEISLSSRLILSPIIGIFLIAIWSFLTGFYPLKTMHLNYEYLPILILSLLFIIRGIKALLNWKSNRSYNKKQQSQKETSGTYPNEKTSKNKHFHTARQAAKSKKEKDSQTTKKEFKSSPEPFIDDFVNKQSQPTNLEIIKLKQSSKDLFLICLIALLSALFIYTPQISSNPTFNAIKMPLIILLMFFIPGYAIFTVSFLKFPDNGWIKKIFSSMVLSIIIFISLGGLMNLLQWGVCSKIILGIIIIISVLTAIICYLRRRKKQKTFKESMWQEEYPQAEKEKLEILKLSLEKEEIEKNKEIKKEIPKDGITEETPIKTGKKSKIGFLTSNWFKYSLITVLSLLGLAISWIPSLESTVIRAVFVIPIIFFLPGYALKELILPAKFQSKKSTILISIVLSVILAIMVGSLLTLIYQDSYHNLCITVLSLISLGSVIGMLWKSKIWTRRTSPLKERYPNYIDELEKEMGIKSPKKSFEEELEDLEKLDKKLESKTKEKTEQIKKMEDSAIPLTNKIQEQETDKGLSPGHEIFEDELRNTFLQEDYFEDKDYDHEVSQKPGKQRSPLKSTSKLSFLSNDLFLIVLLTIITLASIYIPALSNTPLREITGLLFVLFIPGYVLIAALFPRKKDLDSIERLALSFGLSLAISPLIGLALNYTPWGIRLTPIVIVLSSFTLIMTLITILRRRRLNKEDRYSPQFSPIIKSITGSFHNESKWDKILSIILIISLILAISTTVYIVVKPKEGEKFTEFYILGPKGKASDYPTNLTVGQTGKVILGVVNHEYGNVTYRYVVKLQNTTIINQKITLKNNQKWEKTILFTPNLSGVNQKLEFILYKLPDQKKPYRTLHLWVDVA